MSNKKPNIILIAVDSLLSTHMSCYGYQRLTTPHIDEFAGEGVLFDETFSPHVPTTPAYASMLSGRDCFGTEVVALRHKGGLTEKIKTLAEILGESGYQSLCVGFGGNPSSRGFDKYIEYKAWEGREEGYLRKAEALNEAFFPELEKLADGEAPFFVMLRHMDPHSPYLPPAPFNQIFYQGNARDPLNKSMQLVWDFAPFADYFRSWIPGETTDKDWVIAQYDGAVAYMDACIQVIFEKLRRLDLLDNTIVILNGDHGETLYDHECWFDHHGIYDVTLKVPLIIRYPEKLPMGVRVGGCNQHKDLVPTILELAEIDSDQSFDGRSLLKLMNGSETSFESEIYLTECTWMRKHGWRTPEWKLIVALEPDFHFKPVIELYNLISDPDENHNVAEENPDVVSLLRARMETWIVKREKESGNLNPMYDQPGWHNKEGIDYFESSEQAYAGLHIGTAAQARKLQTDDKAD
jgi:arylsulfatase A-like enzyme